MSKILLESDKEHNKEEKDHKSPPRGSEWERGFTVEESRVAEYVELYESIGYKVRVEPATPNEIEDCQECFKADFDNLRTIFIKREDNEMKLKE